MYVGQTYSQAVPFTRTSFNGQNALSTQDGQYLVKYDDQGQNWSLVGRLDNDLSQDELVGHYGLWKDQEITSGHLWNKKVERPKDGQIQQDEVTTFASMNGMSTSIENPWPTIDQVQLLSFSLNHAWQPGAPALMETWRCFNEYNANGWLNG